MLKVDVVSNFRKFKKGDTFEFDVPVTVIASEEKIMIILDEFDKGFSLSNQAKVVNVLTNIGKKFNAQIICISHNYLLISKMKFVYDLDTRTLVTPQKYLEKFQ